MINSAPVITGMSQSSQLRDALLSVRLVEADHYMAAPLPDLDPLVADFR